jgi:hypothetical protein
VEEEARIKVGLWVQLALRLGNRDGRYGTVLHKGDPDAGGVLLVLHGRAGMSVLSQIRTGEGRPAWLRATGPDPVAPVTAEEYVARQIRSDPDLWVLEFESPDMLPPFDAHIV